MRKFIITTCLILSGVLILDSFNFVHSLVMFVLVGVIPGTNTAISADQMLVLVAILLGFIFGRLVNGGIVKITHQVAQHSQPKAATLVK